MGKLFNRKKEDGENPNQEECQDNVMDMDDIESEIDIDIMDDSVIEEHESETESETAPPKEQNVEDADTQPVQDIEGDITLNAVDSEGNPVDVDIVDDSHIEDRHQNNHKEEEDSKFHFVTDEIDSIDEQDVQSEVSGGQLEVKDNAAIITNEPEQPIKVKNLSSVNSKINSFDLFFIKVWAYLISFINIIADGINYVIKAIFKKKAPRKYVAAFVSCMLVVLLSLAVILPVSLNAKADVNEIPLFNAGLIPVQIEGKWGYASEKKIADHSASEALKIPAIYEEVRPFNKYNVAWAKKNDNGKEYWELINTKGKVLGDKKYSDVGEFTDSKLCWVQVGGHYGYVNTKGKMVIKSKYDSAGDFCEGWAPVSMGGECYYINPKDNKKLGQDAQYEQALEFSNGLGAVKKGGRWGYIDKKGREVITIQFDAVTPFVDGKAIVKLGDTCGIINTSGKIIVKYDEYTDIHINDPKLMYYYRKYIKELMPKPTDVIYGENDLDKVDKLLQKLDEWKVYSSNLIEYIKEYYENIIMRQII